MLVNFTLILFLLQYFTGCVKSANTATVEIIGTYRWELLMDIDNSNNDGHVLRTVTVNTVVSSSYNNLVKYIQSSRVQSTTGFDLGESFSVVNVGVKGNVDIEIKNALEKMVETKKELRMETTKSDVYNIGPRSTFKLYRLVFHSPGISYQTDTISSAPHPIDEVIISCQLQQINFLSGIDVVYTSDSISRPIDAIEEVDGWNPDINAGFGGEFVWLVPRWSTRWESGLSGIQFVQQDSANPNYDDLAKGAGGSYRYLKLREDPNFPRKITEIALWRTKSENSKPDNYGWEKWTTDINEGRKGDYLYLCWKTKAAF